MPIDSKHPSYGYWLPEWTKCRDAYDGQRAVKARGRAYLPALKGQPQSEYNAYKERALFYSITSKTVGALLGLAIGKPPELEYPDKMKHAFEDKAGTEFYELLSQAVTEILLMARMGVLLDRPIGGGPVFTRIYDTESIINWDHDDNGTLTMLVLREVYTEIDPNDQYKKDIKIRYRELRMVGGELQITVHKTEDGVKFDPQMSTTILNTGRPMDHIPFFCANPFGLSIEPSKPPMLDIVDINLSHYRTSADLEHGRHFTGLPTPWITGAESENKMNIGSLSAWVIPDANAKVGFLEFTGQGLGSLEKALAEKQSQLASLSARLVDNSTRGSEAAETVRLRYTSETASLRGVVRSVEALVNQVYSEMAFMEGLSGKVNIKLNTDFMDDRMSPAALKAWVEAYLGGGVSKEMLVYALKRGDALPPPGTPQGEIPDPPPRVDPSASPVPTAPQPKSKPTEK